MPKSFLELPNPISSITFSTCSLFTGGFISYTLLQQSTTQSIPDKSLLNIGYPVSSSPISLSWISCSTNIVLSSSFLGNPSTCSLDIALINVVLPQLLGPNNP